MRCLLKSFVNLSNVCYYYICMYSFKITISFSTFPKIANYFITKADQNTKPIAYKAVCVTCNKNRIEYENRMRRKVAWNGCYGLSALQLKNIDCAISKKIFWLSESWFDWQTKWLAEMYSLSCCCIYKIRHISKKTEQQADQTHNLLVSILVFVCNS